AYMLPDVICDFSAVEITQQGENRVQVSGATGRPAPEGYKVSATYADGFRSGVVVTMYGRDSERKGKIFAASVFARSRKMFEFLGMPDFSETFVEVIGTETHYGAARQVGLVREVDVKIAAKHESAMGVGILLKEAAGAGLAAPPGLSGFAGARPKPSPVVRLFSMIIPKDQVNIVVEVEGEALPCDDTPGKPFDCNTLERIPLPEMPPNDHPMVSVPLEALAWGRSGDKGDKANIGIIARRPEFLPYIINEMSAEKVATLFTHFLKGSVECFHLPGPNALNFLLHDVLGGGGVASLRNDPQGKGYAQLLLEQPIQIPKTLAESL
ncbi:MAG: acyclic terpene utilization AtuA family protein, partial [SAR324 cluster bacterium]|nr:acyclic terpene utilization AtuA family protein [SAR324 cluster bacterium]